MVTPGWLVDRARGLAGVLADDWAGFVRAVGGTDCRPGLYAYHTHPPGGMRRIHLRVERDGSGLLLVDVSDVVHLNRAGAWFAKLALDGVGMDTAVRLAGRHFAVGRDALAGDAAVVYALVDHVSHTPDACPTCRLEAIARAELFSHPVRAPYKADLALTYGCNNACAHCYNERGRRAMRSLDAGRWREVLERLAAVGIPHVIFTGGEPTLHGDLEQLIGDARQLGLVTGMNTNGRRLANGALAERLAVAGLDHVQITLQSHRAEVHDAMTAPGAFTETVAGIRRAHAAGLHTITNTTLTRRNMDDVEGLAEFVAQLGLRTFAANGIIYAGEGRDADDALGEEELAPVLVGLRRRAEELGLRFLWYTPTRWCRLSPLALELGARRCNAAEYSICIEPNGDVLPCQSYYEPAGNLLSDPWEKIWEGPLFRRFHGRALDPRGCGLPGECASCPELRQCGGGCPLERAAAGFEPAGGSACRLPVTSG